MGEGKGHAMRDDRHCLVVAIILDGDSRGCFHETVFMKAYLITTGTVFALITLAHLARILAEGARLATDPLFMLLTMATAALSVWAWRLLSRSSRA